jgi:hypothetical protein
MSFGDMLHHNAWLVKSDCKEPPTVASWNLVGDWLARFDGLRRAAELVALACVGYTGAPRLSRHNKQDVPAIANSGGSGAVRAAQAA